MGLKNVYIGKITGVDTDKYPTVTSFLPMYASGITNTTFTWTKNVNSKDVNADDDTETIETVTNITGSFSMLGIDPEVKALLDNVVKDKNGNLIGRNTGTDKPKFVLFYEYKNEKGKKTQMWLYNVTISESRTMNHAQPSDQGDLTYDFTANFVSGMNELLYAEVFEGNTGFLTAAPTALYKEATA